MYVKCECKLPDIWSVLIKPHVPHKEYLPIVNEPRERTVHCKNKITLTHCHLCVAPSYLPCTKVSSQSSYQSNTELCCFPSACSHHGTEHQDWNLFNSSTFSILPQICPYCRAPVLVHNLLIIHNLYTFTTCLLTHHSVSRSIW